MYSRSVNETHLEPLSKTETEWDSLRLINTHKDSLRLKVLNKTPLAELRLPQKNFEDNGNGKKKKKKDKKPLLKALRSFAAASA